MSKKPLSPTLRALLAGISLGLITGLCIAAVLYAKHSTENLIEEIGLKKFDIQISSLLPPEASDPRAKLKCRVVRSEEIGGRMPLYVATLDDKILGYILSYSTNMGYSAPLILVAGFTADKKIYKVDLQISNETPGIGDLVDRKHGDFLDNLNGYGINDAKFDVKKFGGDFDYITGSTVTSRATVKATGIALKVLEKTDISTLPVCRK